MGNEAKDDPSEDFSTVDKTGTAHDVYNPDSYVKIYELYLCVLRVSSLLKSLMSETAFKQLRATAKLR
jgi:hypothetical protein